MARNSNKKIIIIFGFLTIGLLCLLFLNKKSSAADITGISMRFIDKTNLSVDQMNRNFTIFTIKNDYEEKLYYVNIKNSEIAGIEVTFSPSEIIEFQTNMTSTVMMGISANQTALNGSYRMKVWAESRDANWNNVRSRDYYINLTVFSSYIAPNTTSATTSTTTSSVYTTTTEGSGFLNPNNTFSNTIGKNISKNQILIIVAVVMIVLVLIPTLSFKKEPAGIVVPKEEEAKQEEKSS